MTALVVAALLGASPAAEPHATLEGTVLVRDKAPDGQFVPHGSNDGVVVYVVGYEAPAPPGTKPAVISQAGRTFFPNVVAITRGQEVAFENDDNVVHNIFSLDPNFDLGQYKTGSKSQRFDKVGVSEIYCNIHPEMIAWVVVLPNTAFSVTDKQGRFRIEGVRPGRWTVVAWHPRAASRQQVVDFSPGAVARLELTLDATIAIAAHRDKWGGHYDSHRGKGAKGW